MYKVNKNKSIVDIKLKDKLKCLILFESIVTVIRHKTTKLFQQPTKLT